MPRDQIAPPPPRVPAAAVLALVVLAAGMAGTPAAAAGPDGPAASGSLDPFPMPALEPLLDPAGAAFLLDPPAGGRGFVEVRGGHFSEGGKRIRFWGVNLCFAACFPRAEDAPRVAARLASLGVNCVRFHHMDSAPFPQGIFRDRRLEELSPEALERLDLLIAELARRGVYSDLNLHVSRWASRALGWPRAAELESYDKMVDIVHPELIELQKRYAHDLLGHRNPHTGRRYLEEPAVAMVEITNEDSLFEWGSFPRLARLSEPYAGVFRDGWNRWLEGRYGNDGALRAAWKAGRSPWGRTSSATPSSGRRPGGRARRPGSWRPTRAPGRRWSRRGRRRAAPRRASNCRRSPAPPGTCSGSSPALPSGRAGSTRCASPRGRMRRSRWGSASARSASPGPTWGWRRR